jgi:hypothetical protein
MDLSVQDLEAAINFWRSQRPARGNEFALSPEVNALARVYALMIFHRTHTLPADKLEPRTQQLLQTWREQRQ